MSQGSDSENEFESADEGENAETVEAQDHISIKSNKIRVKNVEEEEAGSDVKSCNPSGTHVTKESLPNTGTKNGGTPLLCTENTDLTKNYKPQEADVKEPANADVKHKSNNQCDLTVTQGIKTQPQKVERVLLLKEKKELERENKTLTVKDAKLPVQPPEEKSSPGWGLVGGWSSSFLSTVASSASTFTSHVTQGIGTVLETVEASLGAPSPEELASFNKKAPKLEEQASADAPEEEAGTPSGVVPEIGHAVGGLLGGVSALTRAIENTGSKVITGGLDTLELIGKKTMDILTEGDPGLRKKRNIFGSGSDTTLSQVLKDAKKKYEEENSVSEDSLDETPLVCYSKIFDENQGLVHLEALEILSGCSKAQLEEKLLMLGPDAEAYHSTLQELRTTCLDLPPTDDTPDDEATQDFEKLVNEHMSALPVNLNIEKLKAIQAATRGWVNLCKADQDKGTVRDAKEIYEKVIVSLAELTARSMELFHKMSELLLVMGGDLADLQSFAQHFTGLTAVLCTEIGILTSQFCQCLSTAADDSEDPDAINPLITNVYLEASNSNTYIQDAFQLLIPVFQELAVRKSCT